MKVIIAVDNSECSQAALDDVAKRPWWGDTEFLIVSVVQIMDLAYEGPAYYSDQMFGVREAEMDSAKSLVTSAAEKLRLALPYAKVQSDVEEGNICARIIEKAKEWQADLIVLGSHGRKGFNKLLIGSVAESVLNSAPCSVEVIKIRKNTVAASKQHASKAQVDDRQSVKA